MFKYLKDTKLKIDELIANKQKNERSISVLFDEIDRLKKNKEKSNRLIEFNNMFIKHIIECEDVKLIFKSRTKYSYAIGCDSDTIYMAIFSEDRQVFEIYQVDSDYEPKLKYPVKFYTSRELFDKVKDDTWYLYEIKIGDVTK